MISVGRNTFPIGSTIYQDKEKTGLTKNFYNLSFFDSRRKPMLTVDENVRTLVLKPGL